MVMKNIKIALCLTLLILNSLGATTVIFLEGSSRSGKSSICSAIKQCKNYEAVSSLYVYYCHDIFNDISPEAFACIKSSINYENITHAITKNIFIFKENVSEEQKSNVRQAVQKIQSYFNNPAFCARHMEEFSAFALSIIRSNIKNRLHVLADTGWYVTPEAVREIQPVPIIVSALAYCPLNIVIERILYRNKISLETENIINYRFFCEPLRSFEALYDLNTNSTGSIDTLEKATFLKCLDAIALSLPNTAKSNIASDFIMRDFTHEQLQEYRDLFLKKFGNNETLYVIPKKTYDILLRTDKYTSQECAEQIVTYVANLQQSFLVSN